MKKILFTSCFLLFTAAALWSQTKILFDASKAEMAGNADWVIDGDLFNLGPNSTGVMVTGTGNECNPAVLPTPAQSGVTSTTAENFWKGGLSAWAIEMVKKGYQVESLPYNGSITYGNSSNARDLMNYKVFIVCEPNIKFTTAEKTALKTFVQNGGGLFIIADHNVSDRNNDGWDSPHIWNDFSSTSGNPFGITFDYQNFSMTTSAVANLPTDAILHGVAGNVTQMKYSAGTSMTLSTAANSTVKGLIYKTGSSTTGTTNVMAAKCSYGSGRVVAIGDSSPADDGTGDTNDVLYNGFTAEVSGNHKQFFVNATLWLLGASSFVETDDRSVTETATSNWLYPNPGSTELTIEMQNNTSRLLVYNTTGIIILDVMPGKDQQVQTINVSDWKPGVYFVAQQTEAGVVTSRWVKL